MNSIRIFMEGLALSISSWSRARPPQELRTATPNMPRTTGCLSTAALQGPSPGVDTNPGSRCILESSKVWQRWPLQKSFLLSLMISSGEQNASVMPGAVRNFYLITTHSHDMNSVSSMCRVVLLVKSLQMLNHCLACGLTPRLMKALLLWGTISPLGNMY